MANEIESWSVEEVCEFLRKLEFPSDVTDKFKLNAIQGKDLVLLTEDDMKQDLTMTNLQAKKLTRAVDKEKSDPTITATKSPEAPPSAPSAPPAPLDREPAPYSYVASSQEAYPLQQPPYGAQTHPFPPPPQPPPPQQQQPPGGYLYMAPPPPPPPPTQMGGYPNPSLPLPGQTYQVIQQFVQHPIAKEDLYKFRQIVQTVRAYENVNFDEQLKLENQRLAKQKEAQAISARLVADSKRKMEKELNNLEKLDAGGWYPGKYLKGKAGQEKKYEKGKAEYEAAKKKYDVEVGKLQAIQSYVKAGEQKIVTLTSQSQQYSAAKNDLDATLARVFKGPNPSGDAKERSLATQAESIRPICEEFKQKKMTYTQADNELKQAITAITSSMQKLEKSFQRANVDLFLGPGPTNSRIGGFNDMAKRQDMQAAENMYMMAVQNIARAKMLVPEIPSITDAIIKQPRLLGDVIFDNLISDMIARRKIQDSLNSMRATLESARAAHAWLIAKISSDVDPEYYRLKGNYETLMKQLTDYRMSMMEQAARQAGI